MSPTIQLLGAVVLRRQDGTAAGAGAVATVKALDLLRLLATAEMPWVPAVFCIDQLWPAAPQEKARASLRTAAAQLRKVLGPDAVVRHGDQLRLDLDTDVAVLRGGLARVRELRELGDDAGVLALAHEVEAVCGGDLVVSGGSCDGVYAAREELRELRGALLLVASAAAGRLDRPRECLELARRADELLRSEAAARAVMAAYARLGETRHAVETFERLRARLDTTYGVQPSPRTRAVYLQVVTAGDRLRVAPVDLHPRVAADLAWAVVGLAGRPDPGGVVWLRGEAGSGRGSVVAQAERLLAGAAPAAVRALEVRPEAVRIEAAEADALRREAAELGRVLVVPVRDEVPPGWGAAEARLRVDPLDAAAFGELLRALLQERPSPELERRLWSTSGGLAGHTCRAVRDLVASGRLAWELGAVGAC